MCSGTAHALKLEQAGALILDRERIEISPPFRRIFKVFELYRSRLPGQADKLAGGHDNV